MHVHFLKEVIEELNLLIGSMAKDHLPFVEVCLLVFEDGHEDKNVCFRESFKLLQLGLVLPVELQRRKVDDCILDSKRFILDELVVFGDSLSQ